MPDDNLNPGGNNTPWYSSLPEEFTLEHNGQQVKAKEHSFVKEEAPDLPTFVKNAWHMKRAISAGLTRFPDKSAKDEDRAAWKKEHFPKLAAAGLLSLPPESPDKYTVKRPDGVKWNEDWEKEARTEFHKLGLTDEQFQGALALHNKLMGEANSKLLVGKEEGMAKLKEALGANFEKEMEYSARAAAALYEQVPGAEEFMDATGWGNSPIMHQVMAWIGKNRESDDGFLTPKGAEGVQEAQAEIQKMRSDPSHPMHAAWVNEGHRQHQEAMSYMENLYKKAYGTKEAA